MLRARRGAAMLIEASLICLILTFMAVGIAELRSIAVATSFAADIDLEAKCVAANQANLLRETPYDEVKSAKRTKAYDDYFYEIIVGKEVDNTKPVTINIFQGKSFDPRYVMQLKINAGG